MESWTLCVLFSGAGRRGASGNCIPTEDRGNEGSYVDLGSLRFTRSHGPRGNGVLDALRPIFGGRTTRSGGELHSHGGPWERGFLPRSRVVEIYSFPRSPWEWRLGRSASYFRGPDDAERRGTAFPRRTVGTRVPASISGR